MFDTMSPHKNKRHEGNKAQSHHIQTHTLTRARSLSHKKGMTYCICWLFANNTSIAGVSSRTWFDIFVIKTVLVILVYFFSVGFWLVDCFLSEIKTICEYFVKDDQMDAQINEVRERGAMEIEIEL